jgi:hypothetical protein
LSRTAGPTLPNLLDGERWACSPAGMCLAHFVAVPEHDRQMWRRRAGLH